MLPHSFHTPRTALLASRARFIAFMLLAATTLFAAPTHAWQGFERGINIVKPFNLPTFEGDTPMELPFTAPTATLSDNELERLEAVGFDHVRLPIATSVFIEASPQARAKLDRDLKIFIERLHAAGLNVLIDPHPMPYIPGWAPWDTLTALDAPKYRAYRAYLLDLAALASSRPEGTVLLGLMNEPQRECVREDATDWTVFQHDLYDTVRATAPNLPIVLTGGCWSSVRGLEHLDPSPFDANTLIDIHIYDPYAFTHQSASFAIEPFRSAAGLPYPVRTGGLVASVGASKRLWKERSAQGEPWPDEGAVRRQLIDYHTREKPDRGMIEERFETIADWAEEHGIEPARIYIGEFGAFRAPEPLTAAHAPHRLRWLRDVREVAEGLGYGWAHWEYTSPFGIVADVDTRAFDSPTIKALGLEPVSRSALEGADG